MKNKTMKTQTCPECRNGWKFIPNEGVTQCSNCMATGKIEIKKDCPNKWYVFDHILAKNAKRKFLD